MKIQINENPSLNNTEFKFEKSNSLKKKAKTIEKNYKKENKITI